MENGFVDDNKPIVFETVHSGELIAVPLDSGRVELSFPSSPPPQEMFSSEQISWILSAFDFKQEDIVYTGKTIYDTFIEVTPQAFASITSVNYSVLGKFGGRGVIVTASGGKRTGNAAEPQFDMLSRFFAPL